MVRRRRYRTLPSRFRTKTTYRRTKRVVNTVLKAVSENKFQGYSPEQCIGPTPKPGGGAAANISYHFFNAGGDISGQLAEYTNPMNLYEFKPGTGSDQRIGKTMYIRKSHVKFEIQMTPQTTTGFPYSAVRFRLMIVKRNMQAQKFENEYADPGSTLFLDTQNGQFGYDSTSTNSFMHMCQPINKRQWLVYKDKTFTLSSPISQDQTPAINASTMKYPSRKLFNITLPIMKKVTFAEGPLNVPKNVDTQWLIILQGIIEGTCGYGGEAPRNYAVNVLGTTSALDN